MDIDTLGQRYLSLRDIKLPDKISLSFEENQRVFHLKAFRADGGAMHLDGFWYYTQVPDALVLELGVKDRHLLPDLNYPELFVLTEAREGGYVSDYSTKYRGHIPEEYQDGFDKLLKWFEYMVKSDDPRISTV